MWNAGFHFRGCRRAIVIGFKRRFWNYSYDHRGTASDPGLVVCAVETSNRADIIEGLLIEIPSDNVEGILNMLDVREKCGYIRTVTDAFDHMSTERIGEVFIYCAYREDPNVTVFMNPRNGVDCTLDELEHIARVIRSANGPSGRNIEYLKRLYESLMQWGIYDDHIHTLYELCSGP